MNILNILGEQISGSMGIRRKPRTIQLPITSFCNSRCKTCNVWKIKCGERANIDVDELYSIFNDPYLSKVENVGINGGEPFLHPDIERVICAVCSLPKIKRIYLISNGLATNCILDQLSAIRQITGERGVELFLTISFDGVGSAYSDVRGISDGYEKALRTIQAISEDREAYCDKLTLGVTVSRFNIEHIAEIREEADRLKLPTDFHLAVENRRIRNEGDQREFSILGDPGSTQLAIQLFFGLYKYSKSLRDKLKYYQIYYFLSSDGQERIASCQYRYRDITIDEKCNLYLCAKESHQIGHIEGSIESMLNSNLSKTEQRRICRTCNTCGHYVGAPTIKGLIKFVREMLAPGAWIKYRILSKVPL